MAIEDAYSFHFIQNMKDDYGTADNIRLYGFKSTKSNLTYIVRVEEYPKHIYAIKFYLKAHRNSPYKYRLYTKTNEPRRIINTCINIMLSIYEKDSLASFGFIGANGINEDYNCCTKRFRVYTQLISRYFSDNVFKHLENKSNSSYLMLNKTMLENNLNMIRDIQDFFRNSYDYFE